MTYESTARVITIPATEQPEAIVLRVAAYCRVSSSSDEQLNSFAAQNRYYTELISGNENWKFVDIYADEGITGTSIEKREDFKRMIHDCERGLIDRILVKSISRFARNTTECLETVRKLKAHGISVFFEKENIDTGKVSGEMLTAMFASLAQAESESISKNMRWSYEKRMQSGQFVTSKAPFGYRTNGSKLYIVDDEATIVRYIFNEYISGKNRKEIADELNVLNAPRTKEVLEWKESTIYYVLNNEKYTGNAIVGKRFTTKTFPRIKRKNNGESNKYYITNSHPAIISQETFQLAQDRLKCSTHYTLYNSIFARKIVCRECGAFYKHKRNTNNDYWTCYNHFYSKGLCSNSPVHTESLENAFLALFFKLKYHPEILSDMLDRIIELRNHRMLWSADVIELNKQISDTLSQNQMLATLKQQGLVDPDIFISKSNELSKQLRELKLKKEALLNSESDDCIAQTRQLIDVINDAPEFINGFDDELFNELIDKIIVESNTSLIFRLKNGLELRETIERCHR